MLFSPYLHRTAFGQHVTQHLVDDGRNVNPDLRERPVRPKYEPRPDPIGMALNKVHLVEALTTHVTRLGHIIRRARRHHVAIPTGSTPPTDVEPLGTDA